MKGASRATWAAILTALLVMTVGCADGAEGPESVGHVEGPDSIAEATLHQPVAIDASGRPAARWRQPRSTIAVTLWGSSSCPTVPVDIDVDVDKGRIALTVSDDYEAPEGEVWGCTGDLAPATYVVRLPERLNPVQQAVLIVQEHGKRDVSLSL